MLGKIEKTGVACQGYAQLSRRLKFTPRDGGHFNDNIYADIFYINGEPILHIVDEATRFQSARLLSSVLSELCRNLYGNTGSMPISVHPTSSHMTHVRAT